MHILWGASDVPIRNGSTYGSMSLFHKTRHRSAHCSLDIADSRITGH